MIQLYKLLQEYVPEGLLLIYRLLIKRCKQIRVLDLFGKYLDWIQEQKGLSDGNLFNEVEPNPCETLGKKYLAIVVSLWILQEIWQQLFYRTRDCCAKHYL